MKLIGKSARLISIWQNIPKLKYRKLKSHSFLVLHAISNMVISKQLNIDLERERNIKIKTNRFG